MATVPARAKRVIFLCMSGGPAQLDTFDYKPQTGNKKHPGSVFKFSQHGHSGLWISELMPETAKHADRLCVINGMHADTGNHAQSFLQLHTGERLRRRPSLGSWISYGLGSENEDLPAFISLNAAKPSVYSSAFLPTSFEGTPIGTNGENMSAATISNIAGDHLPLAAKRQQVDFVQAMNRQHLADRDDVRLDGATESMELAFRMQSTAPELLDLSNESETTLQRYRVGKKISEGTCRPTDFGRQCLLARRFAEAGVRFIEVNHGSWDQHKNHRRELTPDDGKDETGHNASGFTFWLAGGGVKGGYVHGRTDDTGARAVEGKVHFRDLHATILHLVGLRHDTLTYFHGGRQHRLTGPGGGKVVHDLSA